jgi:hypothetical protein
MSPLRRAEIPLHCRNAESDWAGCRGGDTIPFSCIGPVVAVGGSRRLVAIFQPVGPVMASASLNRQPCKLRMVAPVAVIEPYLA